MKPVAQVLRVEANAVPNAKGRQFTTVDEPVDSGAREPEQSCYVRHPEQLVLAKVWTATLS